MYGASQWAILILLAKFAEPAQVGQFALSLAICAPVILFGNLQLRTFQATDAASEFAFSDYLGLRIATSLVAVLAISGFTLIAGYHPVTAATIILVAVAKAFESVSDVVYGLMQKHDRLDLVAASLTAKGAVTLALAAIAIVMTKDVRFVAAALALSWGASLFAFDLPRATRVAGASHPRFRPEPLRRLTRAALPLGTASFLESVRQNAPRYLIDNLLGHAALGLFAAAAYGAAIGGRVIISIAYAASAELSRLVLRGDAIGFRRLSLKLCGVAALVALPGIAVALIWGRPFLRWLYNPEYASQVAVFGWIMFAAAFEYIAKMLQFALIAARRVKLQLWLDATALVSVTVIAYLAIPRMGSLGAAIAVAAAAAVQAALALSATANAWKRLA